MSARFRLTDKAIKKSLDALSVQSDEIAKAVVTVGYPASRRREHSFESLARIVVGQQLSTKAAATISQRTVDALGGEWRPEAVLSAAPEILRNAGLSQQKASYLQSLADAVLSGSLSLELASAAVGSGGGSGDHSNTRIWPLVSAHVHDVCPGSTRYLAQWRSGRARWLRTYYGMA